jgi:hypothetical protein
VRSAVALSCRSAASLSCRSRRRPTNHDSLTAARRNDTAISAGHALRVPAQPQEVHPRDEDGLCGAEEARGPRGPDRVP